MLVDDVIEALASHPDPYWARLAAQRVIDDSASDDECEMCAGFGYVSSTDVALTDSEERAMEAAGAFVEKAKKSAAKDHVRALLSIIARLVEEA